MRPNVKRNRTHLRTAQKWDETEPAFWASYVYQSPPVWAFAISKQFRLQRLGHI